MLRLGGHTITVVRPSGWDRHGDPLAGDPVETVVTGCSMQPASTTEDLDGRDTVAELWDLYAPAGTDLSVTDRIRWRGELFEVDGAGQPWDDHRGTGHHVEVRLKRVSG